MAPQLRAVLPTRHALPSQQPWQQESTPVPWQVPADPPSLHASPAAAPAQLETENVPLVETMTPSTVPETSTS
jgi:hypothetical protein